jgi:hypothetical protein
MRRWHCPLQRDVRSVTRDSNNTLNLSERYVSPELWCKKLRKKFVSEAQSCPKADGGHRDTDGMITDLLSACLPMRNQAATCECLLRVTTLRWISRRQKRRKESESDH